MTPDELREILAVLREAGATSARVPVLLGEIPTQLDVTLGPMPRSGGEFPTSDDETEEEQLPAGAFDPIKRRKAERAKAREAVAEEDDA